VRRGMPLSRQASEAARKRAAVELIARQEGVLRQTARRYSLCAADAEDAYQRMLEILLTKAPTDRGRDLVAWAQIVTKHEALAVRRNRERLLGTAPAAPGHALDAAALIPAGGAGPEESAERRESIARSREALQALKPAELRALTLLAAGYSYAEIGELTGFSHTKVNRCLAEGRERFRRLLSRGEDGSRCEEMRPLLSAFCDGEANREQAAALREHLRACAGCRAALRAYRATPGAVAALAPALPLWRSLLDRAHAVLSQLHSRLPGQGATDSVAAQATAAGGAPGAGTAALAKLAVVCLGTAGGAAASVATGLAPLPPGLAPDRPKAPAIERVSPRVAKEQPGGGKAAAERPRRRPQSAPAAPPDGVESTPAPAPATASTQAGEAASPSSGSAAGEFGP
jgi:RNA polymerase sigma factor (sigma-70 family)